MRLKHKTALITGGAGYIGEATAKRFAQEGAVVCLADINKERLDLVLNDIPNALGHVVDVTDEGQTAQWICDIINQFGRIDILVNAAGGPRNRLGRITELTDEDWDLVVDLNLKGTFNCIKAAAAHFIKNKAGRIVNISSTSKDGVPWFNHIGQSSYSSANAGLIGLTRSLAYELGSDNICINSVVPGPIATPKSTIRFESFESDPQVLVSPKRLIPLHRLGTPEDVANAILFLASDEASYITGAMLYVSGGLS